MVTANNQGLPSRLAARHDVAFGEAFWVWCRVAILSFGGPAGQIAVMHRILVDEKRWVSENRFLHALNYCMLLPGPEAQQLATYIGWLLHRTMGGLVAGVLFVLPGFISILALSIVYTMYQGDPIVQGVFYGLKPAVVAVVIEAVVRIGRRSLKNGVMVGVAGAAFVAIYFFQVPFPLIVLSAAVIGFIGGSFWPATFDVLRVHSGKGSNSEHSPALSDEVSSDGPPSLMRTVRVAVTWLVIWLTPVAGVVMFTGRDSVYTQEALFFSKTALVTFGGAYSVLSYVAEQCVNEYHWLTADEMLDGLGMAETTPGPLIQVVQFVGFMGAYRNPGPLSPLAAGVAGSVITTWVTYAPCFLWIFVGAPYIEYLRGKRALNAALSTITAAVVGVILNLSIWFALHTLFGEVSETHRYGMRVFVPNWSTVDWMAIAISAAALVAMFRFKVGMIVTLAVSAGVGLLYFLMVRA